jgi:hypothetical protein
MTDNGHRTRKLDIIADGPRHCHRDCVGFCEPAAGVLLPRCRLDREPLYWENGMTHGDGWLRTERCKRTARKR